MIIFSVTMQYCIFAKTRRKIVTSTNEKRQQYKNLLCGDTLYELTAAYKQGALASRKRVPHHCNPFRDGSQSSYNWNDGYVNESAGEHFRFGLDVITQTRKFNDSTIDDDPSIPRDEIGDVDQEWLRNQLKPS